MQTNEKCKHGPNWLCGVGSLPHKWLALLSSEARCMVQSTLICSRTKSSKLFTNGNATGNLLFTQDVDPLHYHHDVTDSLNTHFRNKWISRGGPCRWPARSPYSTPSDFYLWGWAIDKEVFKTSLYNLEIECMKCYQIIPSQMLKASAADVRRWFKK